MQFFLLFLFFPLLVAAAGNQKVSNFSLAKKLASQIHQDNPKTIYCGCSYKGKKIDLHSCGYKVQKNAGRALRLEWEHVVPAEAFGNSFEEWREGASYCKSKGKKFKGRKCAEKNPEFSFMEADLYNLFPEIGELNGLRSNFSMAALGGPQRGLASFGGCKVVLSDHKFEPEDSAKGVVARTYMYMDLNYPGRGIISSKNQKLFEAWDKMFPVTKWECKRAEKIFHIQVNENQILKERCALLSTNLSR